MKKKYIFLCADPLSNVVFSQVIDYIKALESEGIQFDLCFLLDGRSYFKRSKDRRPYDNIKHIISGNVSCLPTPLRLYKVGITWATMLMYLKLRYARTDRQIVFHTRNIFSAYIAAKLKKQSSNVRYVFDLRGDVIAEYKYSFQQGGIPEHVQRMVLDTLAFREKDVAINADHILCVSSVLKNRLINRCHLEADKVSVIPSCADHQRFYYDSSVRASVRKKLHIEDKFVFVYAGGFGKYHCAQKIVNIMNAVLNKFPETYLLILTPDVEKASKMVEQVLPEQKYLLKRAKPEEVSEYLMASDMGLLLRERDPLNEVASPTKFAEYVMSGLPVLISENIGDYSKFVEDNGLGVVLSHSPSIDECISKIGTFFQHQRKMKRETIAALGAKNFSKATYVPFMRDVYHALDSSSRT